MNRIPQLEFSKRERQIMDIVYREEKVSARDIHEAMPDAPTYTSVRSHLRAMIDKGYLRHTRDGMRYLYSPVVSKKKAKHSILKNTLNNFFSGSPKELVASLLEDNSEIIGINELNEISKLIEKAKKQEL